MLAYDENPFKSDWCHRVCTTRSCWLRELGRGKEHRHERRHRASVNSNEIGVLCERIKPTSHRAKKRDDQRRHSRRRLEFYLSQPSGSVSILGGLGPELSHF
jgi:hypothetical protein